MLMTRWLIWLDGRNWCRCAFEVTATSFRFSCCCCISFKSRIYRISYTQRFFMIWISWQIKINEDTSDQLLNGLESSWNRHFLWCSHALMLNKLFYQKVIIVMQKFAEQNSYSRSIFSPLKQNQRSSTIICSGSNWLATRRNGITNSPS